MRQQNGFKATIFDSIIKIIIFFYVQVSQFEDKLASASLVVLDGNIPVSTIDYVCSISKNHAVPGKALLSNTDSECCRHSFNQLCAYLCLSLLLQSGLSPRMQIRPVSPSCQRAGKPCPTPPPTWLSSAP